MEKTRLSTKGQVILPKAIRDARGWRPGTEFVLEEVPEGLLLRRQRPFPVTRLDDVAGCLKYTGRPKSVAEMNKGIAAEVTARHGRSRY